MLKQELVVELVSAMVLELVGFLLGFMQTYTSIKHKSNFSLIIMWYHIEIVHFKIIYRCDQKKVSYLGTCFCRLSYFTSFY